VPVEIIGRCDVGIVQEDGAWAREGKALGADATQLLGADAVEELGGLSRLAERSRCGTARITGSEVQRYRIRR